MRQYHVHRVDSVMELLEDISLDYIEEPSDELVRFAKRNSNLRNFKISDGKNEVTITPILKEASNVIDYDSAKKVAYGAIVEHENGEVYLPSENVEELEWLPELRQSFHEGDVFERDSDYKYHFNGGEIVTAKASRKPVQRLEEPIKITNITYLGGRFPRKWLLQSDDGNPYYLRERAGCIRLFEGVKRDVEKEVLNIFIGRDHPGTSLNEEEILNMVFSVDFINSVENPDEVPQDILDKYNSGLICSELSEHLEF